MHFLPLGQPPQLVHTFRTFGQSVHGLRGSEPYRNGFWVLNLSSGGSGTLEWDGHSHRFHDGCAVLAPPDVDHVYHFDKPTTKTYAHFRLEAGGPAAPFPVVQDLGERFSEFQATILECRALATAQPERAQATLWHLLWQLTAGPAGGDGPQHHPVILRLMEYLEVHITQPLYPEVIALQVDCSVTHLNRLCRSAFGLPLAAHIRRLRLDRAVHLLAHTRTPAAQIATQVGLPDLQHFNKLVRRHTGKAPRKLRRG